MRQTATSNQRYCMAAKPLHEVDAIEAADMHHNGRGCRLIRILKCGQAQCRDIHELWSQSSAANCKQPAVNQLGWASPND
jgi:hypothetical protein